MSKAECIGGCGRPVVARGMCLMHYKRVRYRGSLERTVKDGKKRHPHYQRWRTCKRKGVHPSWADFWKFAQDIGERPSKDHRLVPVDPDALIGPDNFEWLEPLPFDFKTEEGNRQYRAFIRQVDQNFNRKITLKKYGLSVYEYEHMLKKQNHVCAICKKPEILIRNGKVQPLSVDHDHDTGKIRGLLCVNCNKILGHAHDDVAVLQTAIQYLRKHSSSPEEVISDKKEYGSDLYQLPLGNH